jgi:hypothetical protein
MDTPEPHRHLYKIELYSTHDDTLLVTKWSYCTDDLEAERRAREYLLTERLISDHGAIWDRWQVLLSFQFPHPGPIIARGDEHQTIARDHKRVGHMEAANNG